VITRDKNDLQKKHKHYFSAFSLVKLLFKRNLVDESKLRSKFASQKAGTT